MEECIKEAQYNLTDRTLPRYFVIRNCVLLASAFDDWEDADIWVSRAENCYEVSLEHATQKDDTESLDTLKKLRQELDVLKEFKREDMMHWERETMGEEQFGDIGMEEDGMDKYGDELEEMDDDGYFEDPVAVAEAENELEVAAEAIKLPIRPSTEQLGPVTTVLAPVVVANGDSTPATNTDAENEVKVAVEAIGLPNCPTAKQFGPATTILTPVVATGDNSAPAINTEALPGSNEGVTSTIDVEASAADALSVAPRRLKKQKSTRFSPGGAFHAHSFSKGMGKQGTSRFSALDLDFSKKRNLLCASQHN